MDFLGTVGPGWSIQIWMDLDTPVSSDNELIDAQSEEKLVHRRLQSGLVIWNRSVNNGQRFVELWSRIEPGGETGNETSQNVLVFVFLLLTIFHQDKEILLDISTQNLQHFGTLQRCRIGRVRFVSDLAVNFGSIFGLVEIHWISFHQEIKGEAVELFQTLFGTRVASHDHVGSFFHEMDLQVGCF